MEDQSDSAKLYKTELCRSWEETGSCRYGAKCQFAHGKEDLRPVNRHPKYKTEVCRTFSAAGTCPYGKRCRFIHSHANAGSSTVIGGCAFGSPELGLLRRQSCNPRSRLAVFREICH